MGLRGGTALTTDVLVWHPQLNPGTTPLPYVATGDLQTVGSYPPGSGNITRGTTTGADTNDPSPTLLGWSFVTDDRVVSLPTKGAAWTVSNCSGTECHVVTSAGTKYINGVANASAIEFDLTTAGGYTGVLSEFLQYNRVISPAEVRRNYHTWQKPRINSAGGTLP
jgi:hypothetical protein